ncbi:MAG: MbnP family protein [Bacteroidales bacterium]
MKNHNLILFTFLCIGLIFISCKKKPPEETPPAEAGHITFKFTHVVDGQPLQKDSMMYVNTAGNPYEVSQLMYFISDVRLHKSDGTIKLIEDSIDINYVDIDIPSTLTWNVYDDIPAGTYDSITFVFGITAEKNKSYMFVNYPEVNMMWPDPLGGGYHYMMLNGKWLDTLNNIENFNFHLGIGQLYKSNATNCVDSIYAFVQNFFNVKLPNSSFTLEKNTIKDIEIIMNIDSWFKTPHDFDFNYWGGNIMQIQPAMQMAKENGVDVFTTGTIQ